jgi:mono/diheme cytochrome c family protein
MCVQCHTPRDARGELLADELFRGARMPVRSPFDEAWAFRAPALAGLPGGWSADDLVRFLRTGVTPTGRTASPPMPPFRMTEEDARAVAAYLGSLE